MKKVLILALMFCIIGCTKKDTRSDFEFVVGSIETNEYKELSEITYYNKNLDKVKEQTVKYAGLGTHWRDPIYQGGSVYFHTRGYAGGANIVAGFDLKNGKDSGYKLDRSKIQGIAVTKDNIMTVSNSNGVAYLSLYDKGNETKLKEVNYEMAYSSLVVAANNKIYCFVDFLNTDPEGPTIKQVNLYVYDMELTELSKKDITHIGTTYGKYNIIGNELYVSIQSSVQGEEHGLGIIDLVSYEIKKVELNEKYPHDILQLNEKELLISHTNNVMINGTKIGIYNMETKKEELIDIGRPIVTIVLVDKILYVLTANNYLVSYELKENKVKQLNEVKLEKNNIHKVSFTSTIFGNSKAISET